MTGGQKTWSMPEKHDKTWKNMMNPQKHEKHEKHDQYHAWYLFTYLATGDKLGAIGDIGWKCKRFIFILHFDGYFGPWGSIFWKI